MWHFSDRFETAPESGSEPRLLPSFPRRHSQEAAGACGSPPESSLRSSCDAFAHLLRCQRLHSGSPVLRAFSRSPAPAHRPQSSMRACRRNRNWTGPQARRSQGKYAASSPAEPSQPPEAKAAGRSSGSRKTDAAFQDTARFR